MTRTINDALKSLGVVDTGDRVYADDTFLLSGGAVILNFRQDEGRIGQGALVINDGAGDITIERSVDGTNFFGAWPSHPDESYEIEGAQIHSLRLTPAANSAYRVIIY